MLVLTWIKGEPLPARGNLIDDILKAALLWFGGRVGLNVAGALLL